MNIYVGNLSYDVSEADLTAAFQAHGEVESVRIITDRDTGRSKGFGFIEMPDSDEAKAAISALNESDLAGRNLTVNESRPKAPRNNNRGGFGGGRSRF